jgi:uncharacterized peroxidase-related enzyme
MAWIRILDEKEADDELRAVYQRVKGNRGRISNILAVHSLHPQALQAHMDLYMAIMFKDSELSREQREMIAVVVSSANRCTYCVQHHAEALAHYWKDDEKLSRFLEEFRAVEMGEAMQAVLLYAHQLTTEPHTVAEQDVEHLRTLGWSDPAILTINLIVSYFNFVNRIALGLGVPFTPDEVRGYRY